MEKKKRNGLIIGTILLLGTGIAAYFYLKPKGDKKGEEKSDDKGGETKAPVNTTSPASPSSSGGGVGEPSDVLDFQKFANENGWSPKLVLDGIYGSKTKAAWNALSQKYLASIAPKPQLKAANDVLAYNINGLNSIALYATKTASVFNMSGVKSFTAPVGSLLGVGTSGTRVSGSSWIVYFMKGNVKYWTISDNIGIK